MSEIEEFYRGMTPDGSGRLIEEVWQMSHAELERTHDYIQWLFPTWVRSKFVPDAPVLDLEIREAFLNDEELRSRLLLSLDLMLKFFGLERRDEVIRRSPEFDDLRDHWLTVGNHNQLRLTRIMLSLWTLGFEPVVQSLHQCLRVIALEYRNRVAEETLAHWDDAARVG